MNMKKIYTILLALAALLAVGCTRELAEERQDGDIYIRIEVDGLETKTAGTAEENAVNSLDVFVYKSDESTVLYYTHVSSPTFAAEKSYYEQTTNLAGLAGSPTQDEVKNAVVYAIANYNGSTSIAGTESLATLQALEVDAAKFATPSPFVMTARGGFASGAGNVTVASLQLKRLAAKVALELDIPASITKNGDWEFKAGTTYKATTTWTPMTSGENVRVYLQNAVSNTTLGAASDPAVLPFTYDPVFMNGATVSAPFYTYPVSWTRGDEKEPFIKLILPWRYTTTVKVKKNDVENDVVVDQNVVEFYYKIMFPAGITSFEANTYYLPKVKLNILGGEAARPTVIGADGLTIMNWRGVESSEMPAVTINPSDFLVPERETFEVSNGNPLQIKYFASGDVNFTVKEIYKDVYTNDGTARRYIYSTDPSHTYLSGPIKDTDAVKDRYNKEFSNKDDKTGTDSPWFTNSTFDTDTKSGILTLNHTLSDDFDLPNFAARPYHYEVELSLNDNSSVKKTITIIQNPPVLAIGDLSTGWVCIDNQTAYEGTKSSDAQAITIFRARQSKDDRSDKPIWNNSKAFYNFGTDANHANNSQGYSGGTQYNAYVHAASNRGNDYYMGNVRTYIYLDPKTNNSSRYRVRISVAPNSKLFVCDPREKLSSESDLWHLFTKYYKRSGTSYVETDGLILTGDNTSTASKLTSVDSPYRPTERKDASSYTSATFRPEIAPEFMVASSYGRSTATKYENAVMRCAAYQEDGYPAGRWRLPTEAEIDYCIRLSDMGAIPDLFYPFASNGTDDYGYRASSGRRKSGNSGWLNEGVASTGNDTGDAFVRCVYDTWYWGHEEDNNLKNGTYTEDGKVYQKYKWGGYKTSK